MTTDSTQRWRNRQHMWLPPEDGGFHAGRYKVHGIDEATARAFVLQHHYSGAYPAGRRQYGMFEGEHLVGVAVFGQPMHPQVTEGVFPGMGQAAAELSRFVLLDAVPANGETWFLSRCFRLAGVSGLRGVVAFSDPMPRITRTGDVIMPGHVGQIYRARGGGVYTGRGTARTLWFLPTGQVFSARTRAKITGWECGAAGAVRTLVDLGATPPDEGFPDVASDDRSVWVRHALHQVGAVRHRHRGNHRYAWAIGGRRARQRAVIAIEHQLYPTELDPVAVI